MTHNVVDAAPATWFATPEPLVADATEITKRPIFAPLDSFRAIGMLLVGFGHMYSVHELAQATFGLRILYYAGFTFGLMFFPLSGFLLFRPFVAALLDDSQRPSSTHFWYRRFWRLVPAYWVVLTLILLFDPGTNRPSGLVGYAALYGLVYPYRYKWLTTGMGQAWTVCAELVFCASLPLIAAGMSKVTSGLRDVAARRNRIATLLLAAMAIQIPIRILCARVGGDYLTRGFVVNYAIYNYIDWFAIGMMLALLRESWVRGLRLPRWVEEMAKRPWWSWTVALGLFWLQLQLHHPILPLIVHPGIVQYVARLMLLGLTAGALMLPFTIRTHVPGQLARTLTGPALTFAARVSYGFFLWHFGVIHFFERRWGPVHGVGDAIGRWVVVGSVAVGLAVVTYYVLERPVLRAAEKQWRRLHPRTAP